MRDDDKVGSATGAALTSGTISVEHAAVVATALAELPTELAEATRAAFEVEMVAYAQRVDPRELTIFGHHLLERIDPDTADDALAKQLEREHREAARKRAATRFADGHGSVFYKFRVTEEDDTGIWPVLDTLAAPRPAGDGAQDTRTATQRLADAFVEAFALVSLDGGLPSNGDDRPRVLVTISLAELVTGLGAGLNLDTGAVLSPATLRRLACDAQVIPAVLGGAGQVLDLGHARRTFEGPARLAVIARDGGCIHAGCDRPARWCDVHHVVPWWRGGRTDQDNGVLLCGFHHRLYDDGTWSIRFTADGIPETVPPGWIDATRTPIRHTRFLTRRRPRAA